MSRLTFPPELQDRIIRELVGKGMAESEVRSALKAWNSMAEPSTNIQIGCYRFFEELANGMSAERLTETEELEAVERMKKYGGGFVSALADAWTHADANNKTRLRSTFRDYLMQYHNMGKPR